MWAVRTERFQKRRKGSQPFFWSKQALFSWAGLLLLQQKRRQEQKGQESLCRASNSTSKSEGFSKSIFCDVHCSSAEPLPQLSLSPEPELLFSNPAIIIFHLLQFFSGAFPASALPHSSLCSSAWNSSPNPPRAPQPQTLPQSLPGFHSCLRYPCLWWSEGSQVPLTQTHREGGPSWGTDLLTPGVCSTVLLFGLLVSLKEPGVF